MKKRIPIALAFSDQHLANWKQFNEGYSRIRNAGIVPLTNIFNRASKLGIPVLFTGDLVDHPKRVDNVVLNAFGAVYSFLKTEMIGINGNHDIFKQSSYKDTSLGYLNVLDRLCPNIHCVDKKHYDTENIRVHGVPYFHGDDGFLEAVKERVDNIDPGVFNILLIHRDLAGAVEPTGDILPKDDEQDKPMKKLFKNFDLVLSGHIHQPQKIKALGKNVYMLGSTNQQRRSDMLANVGYWTICKEGNDLVMVYEELNTPKFKTYQEGDEIDDFHYWIKLPADIKSEDLTESGNESFSVEAGREDMIDAYFKVKGINDKRKKAVALKYLNI